MSSPTATPHAAAPNAPTSAGRGTELWLLGFGLVVVLVAFLIVQYAQNGSLSWDLVTYIAAYIVMFAAAHFAIRRFAPFADPVFLPLVALLNGLGLVMIHRLDLGQGRLGETTDVEDHTHYANQQLIWTALGIIVFVAVLAIIRDHRTLSRYSYTLGLAGLVFLAIPSVLPAAWSEVNGSKIWIRTPFFNIQPGEFAKIMLIVFTAAFLVAKRDLFATAGKRVLGIDFPRPRDLAPVLAAWAIAIVVLVIQSDLGSSLLIFGTMLVMLYVATEQISWVIVGLTLFGVGAVIAYFLFDHLQLRVEIWLDPFADFYDRGYQVAQSLFGLANGGVFGTGLGSGRPNIVQFANSDFIIASFAEELGLAGLTGIVMLYLIFIMRGLRTGIAVRDSFGKLLATGLAFTIMVQLFVVIGGVTKLIPLTGLTTPFLSYGGSSLLANYILVALLIRISNAAREPDPATVRRKPSAPVASLPTQVVKRK